MGTIAKDSISITGAGNDRVRLEWNDQDKALDVYIEGVKISSWSVSAGIPSGPAGVFRLTTLDRPNLVNQQNQVLFNVTGLVLVSVYGYLTADLKAETGAGDCVLTMGHGSPPGQSSSMFNTYGNLAAPEGMQAGVMFNISDGTFGSSLPPYQFSPFATTLCLNSNNISFYKTGVDEITQGAMKIFCAWQPLAPGASVASAFAT